MLEKELNNLNKALNEFLSAIEEELKLRKILDVVTKFLERVI